MNPSYRTLLAALCLAGITHPAVAARSQLIGPNGTVTSDHAVAIPGRFIVEFVGQPSVISGTERRIYSDTFARFRRDIAASGTTTLAKRSRTPQVRHEFSTVLFGAAVQI